MANWIGAFRSNYFKVKSVPKFKAWAQTLLSEDTVEVLQNKSHPGKVGISCYGAMPTGQTEDDEDFDFIDELAEHLRPGSVAVLQEVGWEKLRYLTGWSVALDHTGIIAKSGIHDVYVKLNELGRKSVTECEY